MPPTSPARRRSIAVALFFLSGMSGLVYQVIWVRELGRVFGNTLLSASLVTSVFMGGLGLGSFVLGRVADRRHAADTGAPLRLYAWSELGIGALGLLLCALIPRLAPLSAAISSYQPGEHGWLSLSPSAHLLRYTVLLVTIGPATFLMGGTLTLLIRFLTGTELRAIGATVGVLYGVNTAGAALGALLTDFALIKAIGVTGTQLVAVAGNLAAGLGALALLMGERAEGRSDEPRAPDADAASPAPLPSIVRACGAALALSGFAALGFEILWFRHLSGLLGGFRAVFSLLLGTILAGIWIGSIAAGFLHRRLGRPGLLFVVSQTLFTVVTLGLLGLLDHETIFDAQLASLRERLGSGHPGGHALLEIGLNLRMIALVTAAPAILMGAAFPLANAVAQRSSAVVARRAGALYLANTAGNVAGSFLVGFVLLPSLGIQRTALVLGFAAGAAVLPLAVGVLRDEGGGRDRALQLGFPIALGVLGVALFTFSALPPDTLLRPALPDGDQGGSRRLIHVSEGLTETIAITDVPGLERRLFTDGHAMSSTHPRGQRYMRAFTHVPLLQLDAPTDALVICFGVGSTLHAASLHPSVARLSVADLSRHILDQAPYFRASNQGVLADPRVSVFVNDGRHHLLTQPSGAYDLITLEPPPIAYAGTGSLYSRDFYAIARERLKPGGYLTQWLPGYQLGGEAVLSMVRAFVEVFPAAVLLSGSESELILMGVNAPGLTFDPGSIARRLRERPAVQADLEGVDLGTAAELLGMFAASSATLAKATEGAPALTDDRPINEHSRLSHLGAYEARGMAKELFDATAIDAHCPDCLATVPGLRAHLRVTAAIYASETFLFSGRRGGVGGYSIPSDPEARAAIAASPYLQGVFGGAAQLARRMAERHLGERRLDEAVATARYALFHEPESAEAHRILGSALAGEGELDEAAFALEKAVNLDPRSARAHFEFAAVLRRLGEIAGAVEQYGYGLIVDPWDADAHFDLGVALQKGNRAAEADRELATALAIAPSHPRAHLVLCKRSAAQGAPAEAIAHCDLAADYGVAIPDELLAELSPHRGETGGR